MLHHEELSQLEDLLRSGNAAKFIDAVSSANDRKADTVVLTLGAFAGQPDLLYAALRYASLRGMTVTVFPQRDPAEATA